MNSAELATVLESQLLVQLGDRLKRLRKAQGIGTVEMASRMGISRNTLRAIEAGDPSPAIGSYLRAMSILGVSGELALLASDVTRSASEQASGRSRLIRPTVQVRVSADETRHRIEDLRSIALHEAAVRLVESDPELLDQAQATLKTWLRKGESRSVDLWKQWEEILQQRSWRKVLARTRRAQQLRQASPLVSVLPDAMRQSVLDQVKKLKKGITFGSAGGATS